MGSPAEVELDPEDQGGQSAGEQCEVRFAIHSDRLECTEDRYSHDEAELLACFDRCRAGAAGSG